MYPLSICLTGNRLESRYFADSILDSEAPQRVRVISKALEASGFVYALKYYAPSPKFDKDFSYLTSVEPDIVRALRDRRAALIFDTSNEGGKFVARHMAILHDRLRELAICPGQVMYLTQNTLYARHYAAWARSVGISEPIKIGHYHCFLRQMANFVHSDMIASGEFERRRRVALEDVAACRVRSKRYMCLNFTPRPHRVATLLFLVRQGLVCDGLVSFPGLANRKTDISARIELLLRKEPFPWIEELREYLPQLLDITPLSLDVDPFVRVTPVIDVGLHDHYRETYFSLVTESGTRGSGHRRFTEKPFKPVLGLHPFVVVGLPQTLAHLRAFGFQTFSPWIDEAYDEILDDAERVAQALIEFERLCRLPRDELDALCMNVLPAVLHNYNQFNGPLQHYFRTTIEEPLIATLQDMCGAPRQEPRSEMAI